MTLKFNRILEVATQNFIKLSAAVYELSCSQRKKTATTLKTILSSLPRTVNIARIAVNITKTIYLKLVINMPRFRLFSG